MARVTLGVLHIKKNRRIPLDRTHAAAENSEILASDQ